MNGEDGQGIQCTGGRIMGWPRRVHLQRNRDSLPRQMGCESELMLGSASMAGSWLSCLDLALAGRGLDHQSPELWRS